MVHGGRPQVRLRREVIVDLRLVRLDPPRHGTASMRRRSPWPRTRPGPTPAGPPGCRPCSYGSGPCCSLRLALHRPGSVPLLSLDNKDGDAGMGTARGVTNQRRDPASVRLVPLSKDPFQAPTDRDMAPSERRLFVRTHRTCIFGYGRRSDGPPCRSSTTSRRRTATCSWPPWPIGPRRRPSPATARSVSAYSTRAGPSRTCRSTATL